MCAISIWCSNGAPRSAPLVQPTVRHYYLLYLQRTTWQCAISNNFFIFFCFFLISGHYFTYEISNTYIYNKHPYNNHSQHTSSIIYTYIANTQVPSYIHTQPTHSSIVTYYKIFTLFIQHRYPSIHKSFTLIQNKNTNGKEALHPRKLPSIKSNLQNDKQEVGRRKRRLEEYQKKNTRRRIRRILEKKKNKKKTISLLCKLDHFVLT